VGSYRLCTFYPYCNYAVLYFFFLFFLSCIRKRCGFESCIIDVSVNHSVSQLIEAILACYSLSVRLGIGCCHVPYPLPRRERDPQFVHPNQVDKTRQDRSFSEPMTLHPVQPSTYVPLSRIRGICILLTALSGCREGTLPD
jgi:hypothetical protein